MAYEFLKKLFGTPKDGEEPKAMTYEELEAAIDADKDIQVVDLKAGEYVSKEKFDAKLNVLQKWKRSLISTASRFLRSLHRRHIVALRRSTTASASYLKMSPSFAAFAESLVRRKTLFNAAAVAACHMLSASMRTSTRRQQIGYVLSVKLRRPRR